MASRIIQIEIRGEAGNYQATVDRIIDKNNQLNRAAIQGAQATTNAFGNLQRILINIPSFFSGIASGIAGAFGIGSIIAFTKSILNAAGQIDDLSKRTGFSRQTLSGLKSTIEENGGSLDAFANAMNKAQKSLADVEGDGKKAAQALQAIGINIDQMVKASPEKAFEIFAQALSKVEGQNNRVAVATRYMGRAGAEQIPIVLDLADKFKTLREQGVSDAAIKQLDKFGDALVRLKNNAMGLAQEGLAALIRGFDRLFKISDAEKARTEVAKYADQLEILNKKITSTQGASGSRFGIFSSKETQEARRQTELLDLQTKRTAALEGFIDANDKLIRLEQADKEKPATGGAALPFGADEGAVKRQLEAIEQAKTKLLQLNLAMAEAKRATGDYTVDVREHALALIEQEKAAALSAATHSKTLTPALRTLIEAEAEAKIKQFEAAEAARALKDAMTVLNAEMKVNDQALQDRAAVIAATDKDTATLKQRTLDQIELEKQLGDARVDQLTILGRTSEAERLRIENQIKYLEILRQRAVDEVRDTRLIDQQILNQKTQLDQLGKVTINVGQTIASSLGDAFEGVILGTRKLADVGKGLMSALLRDIGSFFTQALVKKLGFENILLTNSKSFVSQLTGAGGFVGGLANAIFGGGGSFGFGTAPAGVAGPSFANSGFFSQPQGAGGGGGAGGALGTVGSVFSTLGTAWTAISSLLPATLTSTITGMATAIGATVSTAITSTLTTITGWLATIPVVGWIAAAVVAAISGIYRIIANQQERPNAKLSGMFEGVSFDELSRQFVPGDINVQIGRKVGIKNSQAGQIADNLQKRLLVLSDQWVGILNIFPDFIADDIQPALDETNRRLNKNFANIKFSPGGSRSIAQELEAMSGPDGLVRFFQAFQPSLAHAFSSTLQRAGIGGGAFTAGTAFEGFKGITPGWKVKQEDWDKFITAIKDVSGVTSQLGTVGASKFLTSGDITGISSLFEQLFSITDMATFTKAAAEIQEKLKPATDFLSQSVQEASELFGRGLIAALEAATESDAQLKFLQTIGEGVKDKIFSGLVEAFTASAQYQDLLAPIQKTIREFAQEALATGEAPDIAAFRAALFPNIEAISSRAQTLAPLIAELQKLGFDIKDSLGLIAEKIEEAPAVAGPTKVEINIENYTREDDPAVLARRIGDLLSGRLAPA